MKRVLCDRHHAALLHSLQMLFEDRLGLEVYVPVGREWYEAGYWRFGEVWGDDRLARQFLVPDTNWERVSEEYLILMGGGDWRTFDPDYPERLIRGVSLDRFRELGGWEYVVATVPENQQGFHRLAGEAGAVSVYQVGNTRQHVDWSLDQRVLVSSEVAIPDGTKALRYRQEFDKDGVFAFVEPPPWRWTVASFVNLLERIPAEWGRFTAAEAALRDFHFFTHGHDSRDGFVQPATAVAERMASYGFAWHDKPTGDGFGHVIHSWASVGRPLVGTAAAYAGQLAEPLWEDGVTCVDLGIRSIDDACRLLRQIADDPDRHARMCRTIRARVDELCDFDAQAGRIAALLER